MDRGGGRGGRTDNSVDRLANGIDLRPAAAAFREPRAEAGVHQNHDLLRAGCRGNVPGADARVVLLAASRVSVTWGACAQGMDG